MTIGPGQLAAMMEAGNVVGRLTDGRVCYRVFLQERAAWQRLQELTKLSEVPTWSYLSHDGTGWWVSTPDPGWFAELEQSILAARRPL